MGRVECVSGGSSGEVESAGMGFDRRCVSHSGPGQRSPRWDPIFHGQSLLITRPAFLLFLKFFKNIFKGLKNFLGIHMMFTILKWKLTIASHVAQLVKNPPAMRETWFQSLGWEDPLEKAKATH